MRRIIISPDKKFKKEEVLIKKVLRRLERVLDLKEKYVEIYLIRDSFNVHAFEAPKNFPRPDLKGFQNLGEVYLCPDFIREQSVKMSFAPVEIAGLAKQNNELIFFLIHGLLHLLGYTHGKKSDRINMEKKEKELMISLAGLI